ncbi:hypothetical protein MTR67_007195 [Solanum verrucosum]|uniref:Retrotransposon gag domain-containing protein n=1 Tax=Solanum verrucosum TaxID=315347 RepID=A0AAF0THY7_SOLVR|nr:hypothetical protein MTR67_007195 [Solanum verrucosum]
MREATKWLADLPRESITSWEELTDAFYVWFFPPLKMVKLRDNIQNCKRVDEYKGVADQLIRGGIMQQLFDIASTILDEMIKINSAWYTREDQVFPLNFGMTKEQIEKNQERDENMAKMMTQMNLLKKHVMGNGYGAMNPAGAIFENKEVQQVSRLKKGSCPSSLRTGGNQGWNMFSEDGWRGYYRDRSNQHRFWRREDDDDACYVYIGNSPRSGDSFGSFLVDDLLSRIINKVEGSDEVLKEMKEDFSSLNKKVNSHSDSIKQLEFQISQLSAQLESKPQRVLPIL